MHRSSVALPIASLSPRVRPGLCERELLGGPDFVMRFLSGDLYQCSDWLTDDGPVTAGNGHDLPWLLDQRVPGVAAVIDDVVERFEDAVR